MMNGEKFSWKKRAKSFVYAFAGILRLIKCEHNARIHIVLTICAITLGILLKISQIEWIAITLCIGGVFSAEAVNSSIETLSDRITTKNDEYIKQAKDYASGAVLFIAIAALIVGCIIFIPKLIDLL